MNSAPTPRRSMPWRTAMTDFTTEEHRLFFREFIRWETAVGGPDPHLATLGAMIRDQPWPERVWRCGCYASGYNVPTAEVIWSAWPWERMRLEGELLPAWVQENWPGGFGLRRERRAVRTASKFARCLMEIADWTEIVTTAPPRWWTAPRGFDAAWKSTGTIYGLGRYVQLKFVEALCRYADGAFRESDIRAKGGRSPREGLALLYPENADWLLSGRYTAQTEYLAASLLNDLGTEGYDVDFFILQVVLCEYKKNFLGRQYPGRTHDTELRYWKAMG